MGTFTSEPPQYDIMKIPGTASMRPPMFNFAKTFGDYLKTLIGQPAPQYQGSLDPGMSPSMQALGVLSQMYANSPMPAVYGQAHASMGRFNAPQFTNAMARMQYGAPDYFGSPYGPDQFLPGGSKLGAIPYAGGMRPYANFTPTLPGQGLQGGPPMRSPMGGGIQPTLPNEGGQIGPMPMRGPLEDFAPQYRPGMQRPMAY